MPRVLRFHTPFAPDRVRQLAAALGLVPASEDVEGLAGEIEAVIYDLFDRVGFPRRFAADAVDPALIPELAMAAGRGLYGEGYLADPPDRDTLIPSPNLRRAMIRDGEALLEACCG